MNKQLSFVAIAVIGLSLTGLGCQNPIDAMQDKVSEKIGEKIAETAIEKATGGKVDLKKNAATFKDEKTGDFQSYGEDIALPENFPADLKKLDGAKISHVSAAGNGSSAALVQVVPSKDLVKVADDVDTMIKGNGYTRATDANLGGTIMRSYEKDKQRLTVMAVQDSENADADVMVTMTLSVDIDEVKTEEAQ